MDRANAALAAASPRRPAIAGASRRPRDRSSGSGRTGSPARHVVARPRGAAGARRAAARAHGRVGGARRSRRRPRCARRRQRRQLRVARHQLAACRARGVAGARRRRAVVEPVPNPPPEADCASRASAPPLRAARPRDRELRCHARARRSTVSASRRAACAPSISDPIPRGACRAPRSAPRRAPHCGCRRIVPVGAVRRRARQRHQQGIRLLWRAWREPVAIGDVGCAAGRRRRRLARGRRGSVEAERRVSARTRALPRLHARTSARCWPPAICSSARALRGLRPQRARSAVPRPRGDGHRDGGRGRAVRRDDVGGAAAAGRDRRRARRSAARVARRRGGMARRAPRRRRRGCARGRGRTMAAELVAVAQRVAGAGDAHEPDAALPHRLRDRLRPHDPGDASPGCG